MRARAGFEPRVVGVVYRQHFGRSLEGDVFDREEPPVVVYDREARRSGKPVGHARHAGRRGKRR